MSGSSSYDIVSPDSRPDMNTIDTATDQTETDIALDTEGGTKETDQDDDGRTNRSWDSPSPDRSNSSATSYLSPHREQLNIPPSARVMKIITSGETTIEFDTGAVPEHVGNERQTNRDPGPELKAVTADKVSSDEPKRIPYSTELRYVTELRDTFGEMISRDTHSKRHYTHEAAGDTHVLEVLRVIEADTSRFNLDAVEKSRALATGVSSAPILLIRSLPLIRALHEISTYHSEPGNAQIVRIPYPYGLLVHHRKELAAHMSVIPPDLSHEDIDERNTHIECALAFIAEEHGEQIRLEEARHKQAIPVSTFSNAWMLFKPGTMVYKRQHGIISAFVVQTVSGGVNEGNIEQYTIQLWNLNFNGRTFGRCFEVEFMKPFDGERPINSLPVYPIEFHIDALNEPTMREQLITRGRNFMPLTKRSYRNYNGSTLTVPRRTYTGAVMIDTAMLPWEEIGDPAFTPVPELNKPEKEKIRRRDNQPAPIPTNTIPAFAAFDKLTVDSELTDDQFFLCSYYVFGYVFSIRNWAVLEVGKIVPRDYDLGLMNKLVISTENKQLIKAICRDYTMDKDEDRRKNWSPDFIPGKGEGQIFLLHGRPGVGKTLTAECVAEYTQRPLLAITPGDIGTEPRYVEESLAKFMRLGERWGAILLLDEADVYLEARNERDLMRNSLVSVFLRALEYYQGILFLTTNRVGSFDEAFASRIHVSIHYGDLGHEGRQKIWENLFDDIESDRPEVLIEYNARSYVAEDAALQSLEWNGRQIRNAFRTAVSLAEYETAEAKDSTNPCKHCKKPGHAHENCWDKHPERRGKTIFIKHQHLKSVTEMSGRFRDYLKSTKDADEAKLAKLSHMRDDSYVDGQPRRGAAKRAS